MTIHLSKKLKCIDNKTNKQTNKQTTESHIKNKN